MGLIFTYDATLQSVLHYSKYTINRRKKKVVKIVIIFVHKRTNDVEVEKKFKMQKNKFNVKSYLRNGDFSTRQYSSRKIYFWMFLLSFCLFVFFFIVSSSFFESIFFTVTNFFSFVLIWSYLICRYILYMKPFIYSKRKIYWIYGWNVETVRKNNEMFWYDQILALRK